MHQLISDFLSQLRRCYPSGEADAIGRMVLEDRFGLTRTDILLGKDNQFSADDEQNLKNILARLMRHEPVQYVLGEAQFCGLTFGVGSGVLIPRPETEELVRWIADDCGERAVKLLDIGTGSGCIAVALAKMLPAAHVSAWDISPSALETAQANAVRNGVIVNVEQHDILTAESTAEPTWDVIVSNPPYVRQSEQADMEPNVKDYEPAEALFVPDDDPLKFYSAIATYSTNSLQKCGHIYMEINSGLAEDTADVFRKMGYSEVEIRCDAFGRQRMIKCKKP
jgi:release factor glutamine methyltransferase